MFWRKRPDDLRDQLVLGFQGELREARQLLLALNQRVQALEGRPTDAEVIGDVKVRMAALEDLVEGHLVEARRLRASAAAHASRVAGPAKEPEPEQPEEPRAPVGNLDQLRAIEARLRK